MPEVTRIEKTFPGPDGFNAAMKEYPALRDQASKDLRGLPLGHRRGREGQPASDLGIRRGGDQEGPLGLDRLPTRSTRRAWPRCG